MVGNNKYIFIVLSCILVVAFQNCGFGFEPGDIDLQGQTELPSSDNGTQQPSEDTTQPQDEISYQGLSADQQDDESIRLTNDGIFCQASASDLGVIDSSYKRVRVFITRELSLYFLKIDVIREILDDGDVELRRFRIDQTIRVDSNPEPQPGVEHYSKDQLFDLYFDSNSMTGRLFIVLDQKEFFDLEMVCETKYNDYTRSHGDEYIEKRNGL